ncbi:MAG: N-acetyltransferase [Leptolyngbya sp. SIO4C1]|nr:N-acetyltransferase [Leptolyngbya sp. SIO4C1]
MSLVIRPAQLADVEPLTELYNRYISETTITFDVEPYTVEQRHCSWFDHYHSTGRHRLFVAELNRRAVGYATSSQFRTKAAYDTSVETSVYLHPDAQGQSIGTRLYETLFAALATEDVHRAYAGITLPNPKSIALHIKFGFYSVGRYREVGRKFDRYWDVEWYEKKLP